jgi:hypothetical protein
MATKILDAFVLLLGLLFFLPSIFGGPWKKRMYLATFPRSGNHWMRLLIEEATHLATSSVYTDPDPPHSLFPFPWGGYCIDHGYEGNRGYPSPKESVAIKTHSPCGITPYFAKLPYCKALRIVRHPLDSFYSLYLFFCGDNPSMQIPRGTLNEYIAQWRSFQEYWNCAHDVVTIRYEDLYNNPYPTFKIALEALGYPTREDDLVRAIAKYPPHGGLLKHSHHYSSDDLQLIERELGDLMRQFGYTIVLEGANRFLEN